MQFVFCPGIVQYPQVVREAEEICLCVIRTGAFIHQPDTEGPGPRSAKRRDGFL